MGSRVICLFPSRRLNTKVVVVVSLHKKRTYIVSSFVLCCIEVKFFISRVRRIEALSWLCCSALCTKKTYRLLSVSLCVWCLLLCLNFFHFWSGALHTCLAALFACQPGNGRAVPSIKNFATATLMSADFSATST